MLLVIVAAGAGLRFWWLSRPGVWGDESATYGRVNGSFFQLLEVLRNDGFAPLHYEVYFLLARFSRLEPFALRVWPAIAGTLTVPAMYFLARQLVPRRESLVAALLTATSAYLLYYSRDAKMYAPLWLFVILSMACFLWWLGRPRQRPAWDVTRIAWWCWVFCTIAAAGIHTPGLMILALQPLVFLAHRGKSLLRGLMMFVGIGLIVAGPIYHYTTFNIWAERIEQDGWNASQLQWVADYNQGRAFPELLRFTASAFATGWEWPDKPGVRSAISPRLLSAAEWTCIVLAAVLAIGLVPWTSLWRSAKRRLTGAPETSKSPGPISLRPTSVGPTSLGPTSLSPTSLGPTSRLFILSVWIVLPAYATYLISFDAPTPPWRLPGWIIAGGPWHWATAGLCLVGLLGMIRKPLDAAGLSAVVAIVFALCCAAHIGVLFQRGHTLGLEPAWPFVSVTVREPKDARMLWMPRYLGAILPAVFVAASVLLCRLPVGIREAAIAAVVLANLTNFAAKVWIDPEPPMREMVSGIMAENSLPDAEARTTTYVRIWPGPGYSPGLATLYSSVGKYHISTLLDTPMDPPTFRNDGWSRRLPGGTIPIRSDVRADSIKAALTRRPLADRVIFWERIDPTADPRKRDPLGKLLGPRWERTLPKSYPTFDHWMWHPLGVFVRYEYVRKPAAPSTNPSR